MCSNFSVVDIRPDIFRAFLLLSQVIGRIEHRSLLQPCLRLRYFPGVLTCLAPGAPKSPLSPGFIPSCVQKSRHQPLHRDSNWWAGTVLSTNVKLPIHPSTNYVHRPVESCIGLNVPRQ